MNSYRFALFLFLYLTALGEANPARNCEDLLNEKRIPDFSKIRSSPNVNWLGEWSLLFGRAYVRVRTDPEPAYVSAGQVRTDLPKQRTGLQLLHELDTKQVVRGAIVDWPELREIEQAFGKLTNENVAEVITRDPWRFIDEAKGLGMARENIRERPFLVQEAVRGFFPAGFAFVTGMNDSVSEKRIVSEILDLLQVAFDSKTDLVPVFFRFALEWESGVPLEPKKLLERSLRYTKISLEIRERLAYLLTLAEKENMPPTEMRRLFLLLVDVAKDITEDGGITSFVSGVPQRWRVGQKHRFWITSQPSYRLLLLSGIDAVEQVVVSRSANESGSAY